MSGRRARRLLVVFALLLVTGLPLTESVDAGGAGLTGEPMGQFVVNRTGIIDVTMQPLGQARADLAPQNAPEAPMAQSATPDAFALFKTVPLGGATGSQAMVVDSPSAAVTDSFFFQVGNKYAVLSALGGTDQWYINPAAAFPAPPGGAFCCNQYAVYHAGYDQVIWLLMYDYSGSTMSGTIRLAANSRAGAETGVGWHMWDIASNAIYNPGQPPAASYWRNAHLALSNNNLWISANRYHSTGMVEGGIILKVPLQDIAAGKSALSVSSYIASGFTSLRLVAGATETMYAAAHYPWNSENPAIHTTRMRVFKLPDRIGGVTTVDVTVPVWYDGLRICPAPSGENWCARANGDIQTGFLTRGSLVFMWNSSAGPGGSGFPYPFVDAVRLDASSLTIIPGVTGRPYMVSSVSSLQYPAAAVNSRGDVGLAVFTSSQSRNVSTAVGIWDEFTTTDTPPPWDMKLIATSSQGPSTAQWGDFIAVTAFQPTGLTWVVSSFGLQGCGTDGACVKPFIAYFGRERDRQSFATWFRYVYSVYLPALTR